MPSLPGLRPGASRRRRTIVLTLWGLVVLAATLVVLAIPLLGVPGNAQAANTDLTAAKTALQAGDIASARASVEQARDNIDNAQDGAQGIGGDLWSRIPFLGTPVADARHLVQALDDVTAVAEIGVDLYPAVAGDQATLFLDGQVEKETLDRVLAGAREAGAHLTSADSELTEVRGTTPFVGDTVSARRDEAADQVGPLADSFTRLEPLLDQLPAFLGFEGERTYLVAMLNPAELRYSGGAALAYAPMSWDQGRLDIGDAFSLDDDLRLRTLNTWRKVRGNDFPPGRHPARQLHVRPVLVDLRRGVAARLALRHGRPLRRRGGRRRGHDGPTARGDRPDHGARRGRADLGQPGRDARRAATTTSTRTRPPMTRPSRASSRRSRRSCSPAATTSRRCGPSRKPPTADIWPSTSAIPHCRPGIADLGFDGDLASPQGDYLGIFTQSTVGSKVDYYQRRSVDLDVTLDPDGSASNRVNVLVHNDTPPYAVPGTDPREGYFTRWSSISASVFLPEDASVKRFSVGGQPWSGRVRTFDGHSYLARSTVIPPGGRTRLRASYAVPGAAEVGESGDLTYRLAMDPQGTVIPAFATVTVHLPDGYRATSLPEGWSAQGTTLTFQTDAFASSVEWEIPLETSD